MSPRAAPSAGAQVTSRLWPVLAMLVMLPAGAKALEAFARGRGGDVLIIAVHARAEGSGDVEGEAGPVTFVEAPLDDEHARARESVRRGDLDAGLALFAAAATRHPDAAALAVEHGFWLLNARRQEAALVELRRAQKLAADDPRVALHLARALRRSKELAEAESELRRALALRPGFGAALFALGGVLLDAKRMDEAQAILEQASATGSNEDRARAYVQLGTVHLGRGHEAKASAAFDAAIQRAPARTEVRLGIARAYLGVDDRAHALKASSIVSTAVELAPDLPEVWTTLGRVREALDDDAGATDAYTRAVHLDASSTFARRRLLRIALEGRRYSVARAHAEQLLADDSEDAEHHFLAGLVAAREERTAASRKHYQDAIAKTADGYPEAWFNLGSLERDAGALDAAVAAFRRALELRPDYSAAANNLGLALASGDQLDEAEVVYRALLARAPSYVPAWINLGKLCSGRKRYADAVAAYKTALAAKPDHPRALLDLGVAYARMGKLDDAIAIYRQLLEKNPRTVSGWYNLGLALEKKALDVEAAAAFDRALALDPEHVSSLKRRAARDNAAGNFADAERRYGEALDLKPADHDTRLALADVYRRAGNIAACAREAQTVLREARGDAALDRKATALLGGCDDAAPKTLPPPADGP